MYSMTVTYPASAEVPFNFGYYVDTHLPLCARLFSDFGYRGVILRTKISPSFDNEIVEHASVDILFDNKEGLQAALGEKGREVSSDIRNFTSAKPRITFSEISLEVLK